MAKIGKDRISSAREIEQLIRKKDYTGAIKEGDKHLKKYPTDHKVEALMAECHTRQNSFVYALDNIRNAQLNAKDLADKKRKYKNLENHIIESYTLFLDQRVKELVGSGQLENAARLLENASTKIIPDSADVHALYTEVCEKICLSPSVDMKTRDEYAAKAANHQSASLLGTPILPITKLRRAVIQLAEKPAYKDEEGKPCETFEKYFGLNPLKIRSIISTTESSKGPSLYREFDKRMLVLEKQISELGKAPKSVAMALPESSGEETKLAIEAQLDNLARDVQFLGSLSDNRRTQLGLLILGRDEDCLTSVVKEMLPDIEVEAITIKYDILKKDGVLNMKHSGGDITLPQELYPAPFTEYNLLKENLENGDNLKAWRNVKRIAEYIERAHAKWGSIESSEPGHTEPKGSK